MANNFRFIRPIGVLPIPIPVLPFEITLQLSLFVSFVLFAKTHFKIFHLLCHIAGH